MKKSSTERFIAFISTFYLIVSFLQGCQKETSINDRKNVKTKLASALVITKIIYHDVVPDTTLASSNASPNRVYNLDLNGDKIADFSIDGRYSRYSYFFSKAVSVSGLNMNGVASDATLPLEMKLNDPITSDLHWIINATLKLRGVSYGPIWYGNWTATMDHYLGLKINSGGRNYYGWVRLDVSVSSLPLFTVKDYAWNSIPDQPILAGQTK